MLYSCMPIKVSGMLLGHARAVVQPDSLHWLAALHVNVVCEPDETVTILNLCSVPT